MPGEAWGAGYPKTKCKTKTPKRDEELAPLQQNNEAGLQTEDLFESRRGNAPGQLRGTRSRLSRISCLRAFSLPGTRWIRNLEFVYE